MNCQERHQICVWERLTDQVWTIYLPFNVQAQLYHKNDDIYKLVCCTLGPEHIFEAENNGQAQHLATLHLKLLAKAKAKRLLRLASDLEED